MKKEIWKDIFGYKGLYQISSFGRVKSLKASTPRILKCGKGGVNPQYKRVTLCGVDYKTIYVHLLVAEYFVKGKTKTKWQVNHKDGNSFNNNYKNLEWVTPQQNSEHRAKVLNRNFKVLDKEKVKRIRKLYPKNTMQELADKFGVSKATIHRVVKRIYWRYL